MNRDALAQLRHLLRPIAKRVANTVARAVIELVDDDKKLQLLQVGALTDETIDDAEHHQPYGFSSVPLAGAEAVVVFPNGDRSHPLVVSVSDRRYRPTGGQAGEVTIYNNAGARVILKADGTIEARSAGGTAGALATLADVQALRSTFNTHVHTGVTVGSGSSGAPSTPASPPGGTTKFKAE
ncbi:MAG TPA: phage baseplate assembly protein V [Gammaproteobacteria bacterium]|nr:phage baseplate assembly protein V [Gammaproteobacteria bacterium]